MVDVTYTVAVTHLNMGETVAAAVRSLVDYTTDEYEIIIVDGGSTDGSLQTLRSLSEAISRVRIVVTDAQEPSTLGADRNVGVQEARGEYVLLQLDADDRYGEGITDFVTVYHQLSDEFGEHFYLKGDNINIAPREFLLDYGPYRAGLDRGEDRDLWRRLCANDDLVWLNHAPISHAIGYEPGALDRVRNYVAESRAEFQSGLTFGSVLRYRLRNGSLLKRLLGVPLLGWAYLQSRGLPSYPAPPGYERKGRLDEEIATRPTTLPELEGQIEGFSMDCSALSERGLEIFYGTDEDRVPRGPSGVSDHS